MKTNSEAQKQLLQNLIKCLNAKSSFSQVGQAFHQATGVKPKTFKAYTPYQKNHNKLIQNKKNKA